MALTGTDIREKLMSLINHERIGKAIELLPTGCSLSSSAN
jgi:hypothetical protein